MSSDYPTLINKKILIADDEEFIRHHIAKRLTSHGMEVIEAGSGEAVLEAMSQEPDIVLMDVKMPVLDGFETTKRIRGIKRYNSIPIVLLSAKALKEDIEYGIKSGATDYLTKPVTFNQIMEKISELLS